MRGDGHHSDLPEFYPRMTPELLGELVGMLLPVVQQRMPAN